MPAKNVVGKRKRRDRNRQGPAKLAELHAERGFFGSRGDRSRPTAYQIWITAFGAATMIA
jgi:hypothetical protein